MNRQGLSTTGYGHHVKRSAEQSSVIQLRTKKKKTPKPPKTNHEPRIQKPEHKEAKNHKNISLAHLH